MSVTTLKQALRAAQDDYTAFFRHHPDEETWNEAATAEYRRLADRVDAAMDRLAEERDRILGSGLGA